MTHSTQPVILVSAELRTQEDRAEGDCACADFPVHPPSSRPILQPELAYRLAPHLAQFPLREGWMLAFQPSSAAGPVVLNIAAQQLLSSFSGPTTLSRASGFGDAAWEESEVAHSLDKLIRSEILVPETYSPRPPHAESQLLTVWMHTTNACNLRCSYCYLNKNAESMSLETGRRALDAVFRSALRHHYAGVKLKYAGGEATLNLPFLFQLHDYAAHLVEQCALRLDEVVLSNGTLLDAAGIDLLRARGMRLMISLDGIGGSHDVQRSHADGRGSFARVAQNIELAQARGLVPDISITVSEQNLNGLPETVKYCLERDLPFSLNFYRENDCSLSTAALRYGEQRMIEAILKTFDVIEAALPKRSLLASLVDRASFSAPHTHACGVGQDYMVIDQHGRIAKCQMEINMPVTDVRADDPLHFIRADAIGVQNRSVEKKEGCRECEYRYWCAGGCALATYRATGRYDVKSPNCNIYKALYPHVLRLEGLRLLKFFLMPIENPERISEPFRDVAQFGETLERLDRCNPIQA